MTNIPIIFIHKGNSFYLKPNLIHTKDLNPLNRVILLGDSANSKLKDLKIEHYNINNYNYEANQFEKIYEHYSPNSYNFELFCFQRWFIIWEFCSKKKIDNFLVCDSDALLFCDVNKEFLKYQQYDYTICKNGTPCFVYFTLNKLRKFLDYMIWCYSSPVGKKRIRDYGRKLKENNKPYGISDMSVFVAMEYLDGANVYHLDSPQNGVAYDHNYMDKNDGFVMKNKFKLTQWENNKPYQYISLNNEKIEILGIHLQGTSKFELHKILEFKYIRPIITKYITELVLYKLRSIKKRIKQHSL